MDIAYKLSIHPIDRPTTRQRNDMTDSPDAPPRLTPTPAAYADWLADLKVRIHAARQRAALAGARELVGLYSQIGREILQRQAERGRGATVIDRLAHDLRTAFRGMKEVARANLVYMGAFAEARPAAEVVQQAVGQFTESLTKGLQSSQPGIEQSESELAAFVPAVSGG